jgi:hypothetical protein
MEPCEFERELRDIARRVERIERHLALASEQPAIEEPPPAGGGAVLPSDASELIPSVGRALLGLAGAYLVRALAEAGTIPLRAGVVAGVLYAAAWLVWAARTPAAQRVQSALQSLTAALVLAPLLWEATLYFGVLSPLAAALILLFFTLFGLAVSWRRNLMTVATISTLTGLATTAALLVATHNVLPFTFVLLATAAAVEASACLNHYLGERWLAATAADLAVLLATWLVTNPNGLPEAYAPIPRAWLICAQVALVFTYLASTAIRTLFRHFTFTGFETGQLAAAVLIGAGGGLRLLPVTVPALMIACGIGSYVVSFVVLERQHASRRNFFTYSTFAILLVLAGSRMLLSGLAAAALWSVLALACIWAGTRLRSLTLELHGGVYLLLALAGSGVIRDAGQSLLAGEGLRPEVAAAAALAGVCWLLARRSLPAFRLALFAVVLWLGAGVAAAALTAAYQITFGPQAPHAYCATLRTSVVSAAALALARAGLSRFVYPAMALGAWRLVAVDLRQEEKTALFLSLLVYGAALMLLPRAKRASAQRQKEFLPPSDVK